MKSSVSEWLDGDAWADIEQMRQPKPIPPAEKKKTVTRYKDMTSEKAERKRKQKKRWINAHHEEMLEYWMRYRQQHREESREACRRWQKKFSEEHGVCYQTWRKWKQTPEGRERIAAWEAEHGKETQ
jgi:hypothetical protein|nr:MAG TPA: hypothetical protein [Caudoviricetes sp.]